MVVELVVAVFKLSTIDVFEPKVPIAELIES